MEDTAAEKAEKAQRTSEKVQRQVEKGKRRTARKAARLERRKERKASGRPAGEGLLFAGNLIDVISDGVHNAVQEIVKVVQERQAQNSAPAAVKTK
jgi:hypothetical protein